MTTAATLSASILALEAVDDDSFYEATELLSTRFNRRSEYGDLRSDAEAPQLLFDWFAHAYSRVPDFRVWDLSCQINHYFDPEFGLYLPRDWPWDTRDRLLSLNDELRSRPEWTRVFERALMVPESSSIRAIACCGAELCGVDPYPAIWSYLCEHVEDGFAWCLIAASIDEHRLPGYLAIARLTLLSGPVHPRELWSAGGHDAHWQVWWEVLRLLEEFPGEGIDLIEAGMQSQDAAIRGQALHAADRHSCCGALPHDTFNLARQLAVDETNNGLRRLFEQLLQHT